MIATIKNWINNLRTFLVQHLPKVFQFIKFIFVGIVSLLIWALYFIGVAADYGLQMLTKLKQKTGDKNV